jgi:DNA polymerase-3 subunit gamma/tau
MSLATKYRPKTWEDVTEQGLVIQMLKTMCESELSNRCFLLTGPAGTGKTTTCRLIATYLNGSIDNLIEIDAASNNGVDAMRNIVQQAETFPIGTKYKIIL